jgi:translation initiation factor 6
MSTIGNIPTVGMAGVATNKGLLLNPGLTKHEIRDIEEITDLPIGTGTINMGNGLVGTGLVANTTGFLVGMSTSGFELSRIDEVFGY